MYAGPGGFRGGEELATKGVLRDIEYICRQIEVERWREEETERRRRCKRKESKRETHLLVHLVHLRKVIHVLQVNVDFNDLLPARSDVFEDCAEVLDRLSLRHRAYNQP